jgi:hypothetical protein
MATIFAGFKLLKMDYIMEYFPEHDQLRVAVKELGIRVSRMTS